MFSVIRLPLPSYLLCPVQRICKYSLLLESLLKVSENEDDEMIVLKAIQAMKKIPQGIVPKLSMKITSRYRKNNVIIKIYPSETE